TTINLGDWSGAYSVTAIVSPCCTYGIVLQNVQMPGVSWTAPITNGEQGILFSWELSYPTNTSYFITTTSGTGVATQATLNVPGQNGPVQPVVQAEDGSFVGSVSTTAGQWMLDFGTGGNINWSVSNDSPYIANSSDGTLGNSGAIYNSSGAATGQIPGSSTYTWDGNDYVVDASGALDQVTATWVPPAAPLFWSIYGASWSGGGTSPVCRDDRDQLIAEYSTYNSGFTPLCSAFTPSSDMNPSKDFTFSQLDTTDIKYGDFTDWAILQTSLLNGIESLLGNYGNPITITSGYRTPLVQNKHFPGHRQDRHIHGDAVDLNAGNATVWQALHDAAKTAKACVEPWQLQQKYNPNHPYDHTHADWRAIDHQSWPGGCPAGW
ncbi:MAG: D-Ala-D-Ala carboxypeptidase family metallohydrolase, partial [Candidatus Acidiferrales bacterium]